MKPGREVPNKWRWRLTRIAVVIVLMGASFAVGVTLTAVVAARILLPIAAMGFVGLASAGANATITALDPKVVALADELVVYININTTSPP